MSDKPTRESCNRCHRISAIGFHSPLWREVAGEHWQHSILCLACFTLLGDERGIKWEEGLSFYPVSIVTHREGYGEEP